MLSPKYFSAIAAPLSTFASLAYGQNSTSNTTCDASTRFPSSFNATGILALPLLSSNEVVNQAYADPIYLTIGVTENETIVERRTYFSFPRSYTTERALKSCYLDFGYFNFTSTGAPGNYSQSCDGVFSKDCREALENPDRIGSTDCSPSGYNLTKIEQLCGKASEGGGITSSSYVFNTADGNSSCAASGLPASLPDGYVSSTGPIFTQDESNDRNYDLAIRQVHVSILRLSVPLPEGSIAASGGFTFLTCLAPSNVTEGSRSPALAAFPSSAGVRNRLINEAVLGSVVVSLVPMLVVW